MSYCHCESCVRACSVKPGWMMPGEAEKIAEYLSLSIEELFRTKLMVDYWIDYGANEVTFALSPAVIGERAGAEFPYNPRGVCIFLKEGKCSIHAVKPFECREYIHTDVQADITARKIVLRDAWKPEQKQITELLGREPEPAENDGSLAFALFGIGKSPW